MINLIFKRYIIFIIQNHANKSKLISLSKHPKLSSPNSIILLQYDFHFSQSKLSKYFNKFFKLHFFTDPKDKYTKIS